MKPGDCCPECGLPLEGARGIEVAQIFQLGDKYSRAMGATLSLIHISYQIAGEPIGLLFAGHVDIEGFEAHIGVERVVLLGLAGRCV